jgi:hypothetical protein
MSGLNIPLERAAGKKLSDMKLTYTFNPAVIVVTPTTMHRFGGGFPGARSMFYLRSGLLML